MLQTGAPPFQEKQFDATPEPPRPDPRDAQIQNLATQLFGIGKAYETQSQDLANAQQAVQEKRDAVIPPAVERAKAAAIAPQPALKTFGYKPAGEPVIPDATPRAFLETNIPEGNGLLSPEGGNALRTIISGIGTIVTSLAGLSAPMGALHALTGSMQGWAEGDAQRVSRDFQRYEAKLSQFQRDNARALQLYNEAKARWGSDLEAANVNLQTSLLEAQLPEYAVQVQEQGLDRTAKLWGMANKQLKSLTTDKNEVMKREIEFLKLQQQVKHQDAGERHQKNQEKHAADVLAATERFRTELLKIKKTGAPAQIMNMKLKLTKNLADVDGQLISLGDFTTQIDHLKGDIALAQKYGVLPQGPSEIDKLTAQGNLQLQIGNTDLAQAVERIRRFGTSTLVRKELEMMMGKGASIMRLKAIGEAEAGDVLRVPKAFWDDFFKDSEKVLGQKLKLLGPIRQSYLESLKAIGPVTETPDDTDAEIAWETQ